jgi:uncharacterized protein YceK
MRMFLGSACLLILLSGCAAVPRQEAAASGPEEWCRAATDGEACRRTSATDHEVCRKHQGDEYDLCRKAVQHLRLLVERQRRASVPEIDV